MDLQFFKSINGYKVEGIWHPRVTAICKIIGKPGLEKWLAKHGSVAAMTEKRNKIFGFGNLVHDTIEKMLMGEAPEVDPLISPSIDAFSNWLKAHKVKAFDVERRVVSNKHFYTGTLDALAEIDGNFGILDLKTTDRVWDDQFIQTAAYFQAHNEGDLKKAKTHWILRIDQYQECNLCGAKKREKGGEPEIKEGDKTCPHKYSRAKGICELKEVNNHQIYLETFLTAKKLWELVNRDLLSQIENYPKKLK